MSYSEVFGGETLYPSGQTYLALTMAVDVDLQWPIEQQIAGMDVVASIIDVSATVGGLNINMPSASSASNGIQSVFTNVGANAVEVRTVTLGSIITIQPGEAWVVYLYDNTTPSGLWRTFQLGATVSVANASALAGAGLRASGVLLDQEAETRTISVPGTLINLADRAKLILYTGVAGTLLLPTAVLNSAGYFIFLRNNSNDAITMQTSDSDPIDGLTTKVVQPTESAIFFFDGTSYYTVGFSSSSVSTFTFLIIDVAGPGGTRILNTTEAAYTAIRFIGAITGNRVVETSNITKEYWISNQTTGAFSLTLKTAAGTGELVPQGEAYILYCDGTNIVNAATSISLSFPIPVVQGGTGGITPAAAQASLNVPPNTRQIIGGAGLTGTGNLGSDITLDVGGGVGITVTATQVALDTGSGRNVDHGSVILSAGTGMSATGLGDISASRTINLDTTNTRNTDHALVSLSGGTGISATGLGNLTANRTINLDTTDVRNVSHSTVILSAGFGIDPSGLGDLTTSRTIGAYLSTTGQEGVIELATQAEVNLGTDPSRAVTPATLAAWSGGGGSQFSPPEVASWSPGGANIIGEYTLIPPTATVMEMLFTRLVINQSNAEIHIEMTDVTFAYGFYSGHGSTLFSSAATYGGAATTLGYSWTNTTPTYRILIKSLNINEAISGIIRFEKLANNDWAINGSVGHSQTGSTTSTCNTLSGTMTASGGVDLDRIRVKMKGADTASGGPVVLRVG